MQTCLRERIPVRYAPPIQEGDTHPFQPRKRASRKPFKRAVQLLEENAHFRQKNVRAVHFTIWPPKPRPSRRFFRCTAVICGRKGLKQWMDPAAAAKEGLAEAVTILRTVDS